jgi:integral membrane protein
MQKEKFFELLGWIGMVTAILMYVFYFQQIQQNLSGGPKGNFLQPFMAGINCTFWVGYGFFKKKRDWPIVIANVPGFVFGFLAAFTSL